MPFPQDWKADWKMLGEIAHEVGSDGDEERTQSGSFDAIQDTLEHVIYLLSKKGDWTTILLIGELWLLIKIALSEKDQ